jgi:serine phosphatase RsbU (regulator of sigma subunit)
MTVLKDAYKMILKLPKIRTLLFPHSVLIACAVFYSAAILLYSLLWMIDARGLQDLSAVELGFETDFIPSEGVQLVKSIYPASPAEKAGLLADDKIILIDGKKVEDGNFLMRTWKQYHPGDTIQMRINRPGVKNVVHITGVFRLRQSTASEGNIEHFVSEVRNSFPVPFIVIGLIVLFLRIEDPIVWILALLFGSFIAAPSFSNKLSMAPAFLPFAMCYQTIFISLLGPFFYFFFAVFPVRSPIDRRMPRLKWISIIIGLSFCVTGIQQGRMMLPPPFYTMAGELLSTRITLIFTVLFIVLGFSSLGLNFFFAQNPEVKRKIRMILWGSGVGVAPNILQAIAREFTGFRGPNWLTTLLVVSLFMFPLSFAYAVVKHRVLEIPVLLKRSARYLLVQRGFTFLLSLASIGVVLLFALSVSNYLESYAQITRPFVVAIGSGFGVALLWGGIRIHKRISGTIDKAFFRKVYDAKLILENLAGESSEATDRRELARLLEHSIMEALHPGFLAVYLRTSDDHFEVVSGIVPREIHTISSQTPFLGELTKSRRPLEFPLSERNEGTEKSPFADLHPECAVPMVGRGGRLTGILLLGSRLSEEAYSNEDKSLLTSVATQAATALENIRLAEEIAEKIETQRKVVQEMEIERRILEADNVRKTKELEEARALQLSMLPKELPVLPNLDIAVFMKTATEIGGDYYDFDVMPDGTLTIALGDATGHGTKAGMMVVIAKSRFTAFSHLPNLLEILKKITHSIKRLHLRSMFISMLLMRIKDKTAILTSAGMPYPLIYRAATQSVEELMLKGMPLGAFTDFPYEQKEVRLSAGDTIILMSDGFPEMFNDKDETLDSSRVKAIIQEVGHKSPQEIIDHLLMTGERWANRKTQDDDVTFIVLKVK